MGADPVRSTVPLTQEQLNELGAISYSSNPNNAVDEYRYIYSIIKDNPNIDDNTKFWFEQAPLINGNTPTTVNLFIRGYTATGLSLSGTTEPIDLQVVSNDIAARVILDIFAEQGIPDLSIMLARDIEASFEVGHIESLGGWGGSFYYWNIAAYDPVKWGTLPFFFA